MTAPTKLCEGTDQHHDRRQIGNKPSLEPARGIRGLEPARVPVPIFASYRSAVWSKCRHHEEHEQGYDSNLASTSHVWFLDQPRLETKRQLRYTSDISTSATGEKGRARSVADVDLVTWPLVDPASGGGGFS